jgi:hypothetical protein
VEHCWNRVPAALTYDYNNHALAVLIASETAINPIFLEVGGLHVAAEIPAINFGLFAFPADNAASFPQPSLRQRVPQRPRPSLLGRLDSQPPVLFITNCGRPRSSCICFFDGLIGLPTSISLSLRGSLQL